MRKVKEQPARMDSQPDLRFCSWGSKAMISGIWNKARGSLTPGRRFVSGWACVGALWLLVLSAPPSFVGGGPWGRQRGQAARPAPMRTAPVRPQARPAAPQNKNGNANGAARPAGPNPYQMRPGVGGNPGMMRPGVNGQQGHLGDWLNNHRNLSPQQQEEELRREPGFNRLSPDQQQRVLGRLRTLESRPPEQQQRMVGRVEMFERLSPQQKADVRNFPEEMRQMPANRQAIVRRAFNDLRQIPPDQRTAILNSARFSQTFSPEERHVLGSMLSIEPYEPR